MSLECPKCRAYGPQVRAVDWAERDGLFSPSKYHCQRCGETWEA